ncbi:hypothetical protein BV22DRAFT_1092349 [Leucogyrophana mollusca]|uniref:Uncharacterized protein n=1 Tax=Leucogyrophana mollusca TaxID=85980 RepID=A0ACB8BGS0_9AGAM|nr:hypothetical protein BV22DRAFT_1092349 [Leucogyrophana mollusca]
MAAVTTIHPSRPSNAIPPSLSPNLHVNIFQRGLAISDLDFKDNRYPSLNPDKGAQRTSTMVLASSDMQPWSGVPRGLDPDRKAGFGPTGATNHPAGPRQREEQGQGQEAESRPQSSGDQEGQPQYPPKTDNVVSYALPQGPARRVVERYSLDETSQPISKGSSTDNKLLFNDSLKSLQESATASQHAPSPSQPATRDVPPSLLPANLHRPSVPGVDIPGPSNPSRISPNILSTSPTYSPTMGISIPISPNPRAYAQHPTYITPAAAPDPINPILSPNPPVPPEEVCVECAMRDQDMADVTVVGPGVWDRESDVLYEELLRREQEEEALGVISSECSTRPRARGGRLTEQNLKVWATMTPREPTSRQQTIDLYVKAQRSLLEAEALAHARAMQESMQLENKMRDTYSQLRRSAYDIGSGVTSVDDGGPLRLKTGRSPTTPNAPSGHHIRQSSREVTLLENGLIVEHVDVRREEKEEKERRRRQEKRDRSRARKSSRGSAVDVTSLYSVHSLAPHTDSGLGLMPSTRYSGASSARPVSSLTAPIDRQSSLGQVYSQASFSDAHSPGSASPRRSRFFGFRNLSSAWRSQDSLAVSGMSGSMIDMHVALQREANGQRVRSPVGERSRLSSQRHSQLWPPVDQEPTPQASDEKPKKKKTGLAKIWKFVKGSTNKEDSSGSIRGSVRSQDRNEDDFPLAPPPPLSYLVERGPGDHITPGARHGSTPSLPSTSSPRNALSSPGMSPPTAPSSILPSPTSSRPSGMDRDAAAERKNSGHTDEKENVDLSSDDISRMAGPRVVHPVTSEPDMRQRLQQATFASANGMTLPITRPLVTLSREKSLPPLPGETKRRPSNGSADPRPQTLYTYNPRQNGQEVGDLAPPHAPFHADVRRQSFGGTASRPNLGIQTLPLVGGYDHSRAAGGLYSEFGISRRSLGRLEHIDENPSLPPTPHKRRSKFGFAALLGRKSTPPEIVTSNGLGAHEFPRLATPVFDGGEDSQTTAYTHSMSRQSGATRMSVTSRKALEERVEQDREFVAYRYPSHDQRLDLIR